MNHTARRLLPARRCWPSANRDFVFQYIYILFFKLCTHRMPRNNLARQRELEAHEQREQARNERTLVAARVLPQGAERDGGVDQRSTVRAVAQLRRRERRRDALFERDGGCVAEAVRKRVVGASFFKRL
jgi:hypothetical protein